MKFSHNSYPCPPGRRRPRGFTLIEISLVIGLMLGLTALVGFNISSMQDWHKGKNAALSLQAVFAAQRSYMSDHPTADIATVSAAELQPYLPEGWSLMPTFTSLTNAPLNLDHTTMPPRLYHSGAVYDPSGSLTDGLWDVGQ